MVMLVSPMHFFRIPTLFVDSSFTRVQASSSLRVWRSLRSEALLIDTQFSCSLRLTTLIVTHRIIRNDSLWGSLQNRSSLLLTSSNFFFLSSRIQYPFVKQSLVQNKRKGETPNSFRRRRSAARTSRVSGSKTSTLHINSALTFFPHFWNLLHHEPWCMTLLCGAHSVVVVYREKREAMRALIPERSARRVTASCLQSWYGGMGKNTWQ